MRIVHWDPKYREPKKSHIAAVGVFDGIHRGHQAILQAVREDAKAAGVKSMVVTFEPYPRRLFSGGDKVKRLTSIREKAKLLSRMDIDVMVCVPFTPEFAAYHPEQFVSDVLIHSLGVMSVGVGFNFRFGQKGSGDAAMLERLGELYGMGVRIFPPVEINGRLISSTLIRETLAVGDVEEAARYLGYPYRLSGTVLMGDQRGRTLGYPTANVWVAEDTMTPALGVYGVWVYHGKDRRYAGMANLGLRPTFAGSTAAEVRLEVYILDFDEDIYGDTLTVEFIHRIRSEKAFSGAEALKDQLKEDERVIRQRLLGSQP